MRTRMIFRLATMLLAAIAFAISAATNEAGAQAQSTWEQIMSTKKIRSGAIDFPPYWWREGGKWRGAMVSMSEDVAKNLGVELEMVATTWATATLELQSNRIDMQFGVQATPQRAKAIYFAGPIYNIAFAMVNGPAFKGGKTWADYNQPGVKIAVQTGGTSEVILRKMAPKANHVQLATLPETIMAVTSGRADAFATTSMAALTGKQKNPELGNFTIPTPFVTLPGYIGLRADVGDFRFKEFLEKWGEWNMLLGINEMLLKENLNAMGITDIPDEIHF